MKQAMIAFILFIGLLYPQILVGELVVNDFGDDDDFSNSSTIYLIREAWENNFNIPGGDADFIHQETDSSFWIFTEAPNQPGLIKARVIRMTTCAEFQTDTIPSFSDSLFLGIRFKDNLPKVYGAMPVYSHNGASWVQIGTIGGLYDHTWKVAVIVVPKIHLSINNGNYRFKLGKGFWDSGLTGDLPLDRIELASTRAELTVEPDDPGFYPAAGDGNFPNLTKDSCWSVDNKPFFPIGFAAGWTGMSEDVWQNMADAGFNTILFYNWMQISDPYAAGEVWGILPSSGHYGFLEFLNKSEEAGLKVIGVFQNDIKYAVVQNYFKSEAATLNFIKDVCATHRGHPALLAWSPVDEPDHSYIPEFYAPLEWCMAIKDAIRQGDPTHPLYALEIRWRKGGFGHYKDITDFQGYDVYPAFGDPVSLIGQRADHLIEETQGEKPFIAFLKAYDRTAQQAYMSFAEAYLALIHQANGIFYWSYGDSAPLWDTLSKIANEVNALNPALLTSAYTLDINGKNNLCTNTQNPQIEQTFKKGNDSKGYILAVNTENQPTNAIQFTVEGLEPGTEIQVLFENRTITAGSGTFQDNFPAYGRHVYQFPTTVPVNNPQTFLKPPKQLRILDNQSNKTSITFILNARLSKTSLHIYTLKGHRLALLPGIMLNGQVKWIWDTKDIKNQIARNILIAHIQLGSSILTKPFVLF